MFHHFPSLSALHWIFIALCSDLYTVSEICMHLWDSALGTTAPKQQQEHAASHSPQFCSGRYRFEVLPSLFVKRTCNLKCILVSQNIAALLSQQMLRKVNPWVICVSNVKPVFKFTIHSWWNTSTVFSLGQGLSLSHVSCQ